MVVLVTVKLRLVVWGLCIIGISVLAGLHFFWNYQIVAGGVGQGVIIDPGHGGVDGGTCDSLGNLEKKINLDIGLRLREHLQQSGLPVFMTRETDVDLAPFQSGKRGRHRRDLEGRLQKAQDNNPRFLVSLHCDWSREPNEQGTVIFYNYRSPASKALALCLQNEVNLIQAKPRKAAPGRFLIIRQSNLTGVLVELGFLSNYEEAKRLQQPEYQAVLAMALTKGILKYYHHSYEQQ